MKKIHVYEFMSYCPSKREIHTLLSTTGGVYLADVDCVNVFYMRDLAQKKKKVSLVDKLIV